MTEMKSDSVLVCAPEIDLHINSRKKVDVRLNQKLIARGNHTLAILYAFRQPTSLKDAVEKLRVFIMSKLDWIDLMNEILTLQHAGLLVEPTQAQPRISEVMTFDAAHVHIAMLNDRQRTQSYLDAIREVVQPGDVVVDMGTGTGVLAIAAVMAGARRVYAIELGTIGEVAQKNFERNHMADRITLIRGRSSEIKLDEKADVLISEIIGSDPLRERIVEYTMDAVARFLKPNARLIPSHLRLYALPLTIPAEKRSQFVFTDDLVEQWKHWYGIDFSELKTARTQKPIQIFLKPHLPRDWHPLSSPILLESLDFASLTTMTVENSSRFTVESGGQFDGVLIYPDVDLSPTITLTRAPAQVDEQNSWKTPFWILPDAIETQPGDRFAITYRYGVENAEDQFSIQRIEI